MAQQGIRPEDLRPVVTQLATAVRALEQLSQQGGQGGGGGGVGQGEDPVQNAPYDPQVDEAGQLDYENRYSQEYTDVQGIREFYQTQDMSTGVSRLSLTWTWSDRTFKAVEVKNQRLVLNSNGDTLHSVYMKNVSSIHNKHVGMRIEAYRVDTGALVFSFAYVGGRYGRGYEETKVYNHFNQNVQTHWNDIARGNMRFEAIHSVRDLN